MASAQRRLKKLTERKDVTTDDPLMAEIALAQVDATLAVALASQPVAIDPDGIQRVRIVHDPFAPGSGMSYDEKRAFIRLQYDVAWLKGELKFVRQSQEAGQSPSQPPPPQPEPRRWWRWWQP